ncbi:MAG: hypothetical protein HZA01_05760 [Nitrospinae bacterium]|nr:hypothetical protein [Nitrospinota bacterium]
MKRYIPLIIFWLALVHSSTAWAFGECGLSCCIGGAVNSGGALAENLGLSFQYEYMHMESILDGGREISPTGALNQNWKRGGYYTVPDNMIMEKYTLTAAYPATERLQFLGILPYVKNNMDMLMKSSTGTVMRHRMDTVDGLGDISLLGLYTAYTDAPIRPSRRLTLGLGLKTPTGKNDERTSTGAMVHAMMQPGSGSWDPLFLANYMRAFYPLILQANLLYHLSNKGDEGYEYGDQLSYDLIARLQAHNYINLGLEINGIHAWRDKDHDGKYSHPLSSMMDNPDYTGLNSIFLSPHFQIKIPNTGGSVQVKYQTPVFQEVNGLQQVVDWRILMSTSWAF